MTRFTKPCHLAPCLIVFCLVSFTPDAFGQNGDNQAALALQKEQSDKARESLRNTAP